MSLVKLVKLLALALISLLSVACQDVPRDTFVTDEPLFAAATEAADRWCVATDGEFCPEVVAFGKGNRIRLVTADQMVESGKNPDMCGYNAKWETRQPDLTTEQHIEIAVRDTAANGTDKRCVFPGRSAHANLVAILVHEMGHNLLPHNASKNSIMQPGISAWTQPMQEDAENAVKAE